MEKIKQFFGVWVIRKTPSSLIASILVSWGLAHMTIPWEYLPDISPEKLKTLAQIPEWINGVIGFCILMAVFQALRAAILAHSISPKVIAAFNPDNKCLLITPLTVPQLGNATVGNAYYIRIAVNNKGYKVATDVSAQLVDIQIKRGQTFEETTFRTPLRLRGGTSITVIKNVPDYFNIFCIESTDNRAKLIDGLNEYRDVFTEIGFYKLIIQISEPSASQCIILGFDWRGTFERPLVTLL